MFGLAVRTLRYRMAAFVAAFVAMVLGAAMVMACGGLMETGIRTAVPPQQLTGADLVATVAAVAGVAAAEGHVLDEPAPAGTVDATAASV